MDIKSEVLKYIDLAEDTAKASLQLHLTDMSDQNYNESPIKTTTNLLN